MSFRQDNMVSGQDSIANGQNNTALNKLILYADPIRQSRRSIKNAFARLPLLNGVVFDHAAYVLNFSIQI